MAEIALSVSFARLSDLSWIVENDTHMAEEMVERKLQAQAYLIAKVIGMTNMFYSLRHPTNACVRLTGFKDMGEANG